MRFNLRNFFFVFFIIFIALPAVVFGQDTAVKEKVYQFDDMLIDGTFRNPQGMFERSREEAQFEGVLNLSRSFIVRVSDAVQEPVMRP